MLSLTAACVCVFMQARNFSVWIWASRYGKVADWNPRGCPAALCTV